MNLSDVEHCGKMRALEKLMSTWVLHGDKILLFSYSVSMLDILEKFLIRKGYCFSRLDGSTPTSSRQPLVDDFNSSPSKQKRHVVFFRLLAAGSLEELVYSHQVYKQQLSNIAVSGKMEKRYFEGVQACKEFQGELFGISNLFRDLSDKLFTSEIIELNGKHDQNHGNHNDQTEDIVRTCPPSKKENETSFAESEGRIVYTHRNEDVVNYRPEVQAKKDMTVAEPDSTQHQRVTSSVKRHSYSSSDLSKRELSLSKKKSQYSRLAQFMGMTDIKFSKWLLSVSNSEREKVLLDYKKQKENNQNG
ncbi:hypothetical protein MKX01_037332 [Papaver californicum]|nr:hypothetical protein MKX01_037332 [Papaver californicum]